MSSVSQNNIVSSVNYGAKLIQDGKLDTASDLLNKVISIDKKQADAIHLLGVIKHMKGQKSVAIRLIKKAIKLDPRVSIYHRNLGLILSEMEKYSIAITEFKKAISYNRSDAQSHSDLGVIYSKQGKINDAILEYKMAIKKDPYNFSAYNNLGSDLMKNGEVQEAIINFSKAIRVNERFFDAYFNIGNAYTDSGMLHDAITAYQNALNINPKSKETYNNLGNALKDIGSLDHAIICYKKAIKIDHTYVLAYINLGNAQRGNGSINQAILSYKQALNINLYEPYVHLGIGNAYLDHGDLDRAIDSYKQEVDAHPTTESISRLLESLRMACAWNEISDLQKSLDALKSCDINSFNSTPVAPFISLYIAQNPSVLLSDTEAWCKDNLYKYYSSPLRFSFDNPAQRNKKIRVGYLSHDFRLHAVGILVHDLFKYHDRNIFQIYAYSYGVNDNSIYRNKVISGSDYFIDIRSLDHFSAAQTIHNDKIDILVDLTGFTRGGRHQICAYKPAPIQINYLGFTGSSGANFFDYIITDWILSPLGYECYFSEKLVRLPDCYQVNSQSIEPSSNGYKRADFSLPDNEIVFCSFNNARKIDVTVFESWMKILRNVNGSVLWLHEKNALQVKNLKKEAEMVGINPDRLIFTGTMPIDEHLERHALADIALDTFIYNGGITTSLSLASNVPVVTLQGDRYISRMSSSLLSAVSLPELITHSSDQYEDLAIALALDSHLLCEIKNKLLSNVRNGPLFNPEVFANNIEKAYKRVWDAYISGDKVDHVDITY